jgi:hypothetical protein
MQFEVNLEERFCDTASYSDKYGSCVCLPDESDVVYCADNLQDMFVGPTHINVEATVDSCRTDRKQQQTRKKGTPAAQIYP